LLGGGRLERVAHDRLHPDQLAGALAWLSTGPIPHGGRRSAEEEAHVVNRNIELLSFS
jgi:hypothetical protein